MLWANSKSWPLEFTSVSIQLGDYKPKSEATAPSDCEPELFDPSVTRFHLEKTDGFPKEQYIIDGGDERVSMMIDGWAKEGENKITMPQPYSVIQYEFGCASQFDKVIEIKNNDQRYALYTHVYNFKFSPNFEHMILYNAQKTDNNLWLFKRRIVTLRDKSSVALPYIDATSFVAYVTNDRVVTYGSPVNKGSDQRRIVCIWGLDGKLQRALRSPINTTNANSEESDDLIGLLPNEATTFYQLTFGKEKSCILYLQDINNSNQHRSIVISFAGFTEETASIESGFQLDLSHLTLHGGILRYRVSASGRPDIDNDWSAWMIAK